MKNWCIINIDEKIIKKERDKAKLLKKTAWWKNKIKDGICYYCRSKFLAKELTMDHIVPIARGGKSVKNNLVPSCLKCNQNKKLAIPVENILDKIEIADKE